MLDRDLRPERRAAEDAEHGGVFVEDSGGEPLDALRPGVLGEPLEERRADAVALERVFDDEGDLGRMRRIALVAADAVDGVAVERAGDESGAVAEGTEGAISRVNMDPECAAAYIGQADFSPRDSKNESTTASA